MAWNASKAKIANPKITKSFLIGGISFQGCFVALLILVQNLFNMTSEPIVCSSLQHTIKIEVQYISILATIELTLIILFGLLFDVSLYFFMVQRNNHLIPWKSSRDDPAVPIKATLVSTVSLGVKYSSIKILKQKISSLQIF